jgi:hypothetical protein
MIVYDTHDYCFFLLCPSSGIVKNTTFQNLDLFPSPGEEVGDTYSLGSIRKG